MEAVRDVLQVIDAGAEKPTHIMYRANLSWSFTQLYIKSLEAQGLLVVGSEHGKHSYHLSEKGFQLLSQFNAIREGFDIPNES